MVGYHHHSDVIEALALTSERCLVLTDFEREECSVFSVHVVAKGVDFLDTGQAISVVHVRNDDRTNDQKRII